MPPSNHSYGTDPPILKQVVDTIVKYRMLTPGERVLVGVSGGPDSVALLHLLEALAPAYHLQLGVAHLNHGLRSPAADIEATQVAQLAEKLGLAFHVKQIHLDPQQGSLEDRARQVRYRFFNELADRHGYAKIALGHQADDNAESVLLNLIRGSGLRGLSGIPPVRHPRIVRPLIDIHRAEIMTYLKRRHLPYMLDGSNIDLRFDRNRIRHQLLPLLQRDYNPNITATLHRTAGICRDEDQWLDRHLQPVVDKMTTASTPRSLVLNLDLLAEQPRVLKRRLIRSALGQWRGHLRRITALHVEMLIDLIASDRSSSHLNLPGGLTAQRDLRRLQFSFLKNRRNFPSPPATSFHYALHAAETLPARLIIPEAGVRLDFTTGPPPKIQDFGGLDNSIAWFDLDRLGFPLFVRSRSPGDRLVPLGTQGTQKLKKLFIDFKIPRGRRSRIPILANADTIYWVTGLRRSNAALIDETTTQALCITCRHLAEDP